MKEKIFDIKKPSSDLSPLEPEKTLRSPKIQSPFGKGFYKKSVKIILGVVLVTGIVAGASFVFGEVLVVAHLQSYQKNVEVMVELNIAQPFLDVENRVIPARFFSASKTEKTVVSSTGKKDSSQKAHGVITVYNEYQPPRSFVFRENTRFLASPSGKIFRAPKKIYIPKAHFEGGELKPGTVEVEVFAQEAGEDYNIAPSKFSIPGLKGTPYYFSIWAESSSPMTGGQIQTESMITAEDLERARDKLEQNLIEGTKSQIKKTLPVGFDLAPAYLIEDFSYDFSHKEGDIVPSFEATGTISVKMLAFKKNDLKKIVFNELSNLLEPDERIDDRYWTFSLESQNLLSEKGKLVVRVSSQVKVYKFVSKDQIVSLTKNSSQTQAQDLVQRHYQNIRYLSFRFYPFWLKYFPKLPSRQRIEIKIE